MFQLANTLKAAAKSDKINDVTVGKGRTSSYIIIEFRKKKLSIRQSKKAKVG